MRRLKGQAFVGTAKRTFRQALIRQLQTDYGLLGSERILNLLAQDVQDLVDQFYPVSERVHPGWMTFTGVKACGPKPHPGQSAADHDLVTVSWPVLLREDLEKLQTIRGKEAYRLWQQTRLVRLVEYGWEHPNGPILLTLADLTAMLGVSSPKKTSQLLRKAREATGKNLLTKGLYFDQGMRPTHKAEVVALYEQGMDETDIARQLSHSLEGVGHYLRDYERVKLALKQSIPITQIDRLLNMQPSVVRAYVEMVEKYHPNISIVKEQNTEPKLD